MSATAAPSTSKSIWVSEYCLITDWYAAASALAEPQLCASSVPASPPKETRTSPPAARRLAMSPEMEESVIAVTPPHFGVQPPPAVMNARLKNLVPSAAASPLRL